MWMIPRVRTVEPHVSQLGFSRPKSERGRAFAPPQMLQ